MTSTFLIAPSIFQVRKIVSVCAFACVLQNTHAQTTTTANDALRNIEQTNQTLKRTEVQPAAKKLTAPESAHQAIPMLHEIRVQSPLFQQELMKFWLPELKKQISPQKLTDFKTFAWNLFQSKGYLAYITTQTQSTDQGSVLIVNVSIPKVAKVSVISDPSDLDQRLSIEVAKRFSDIYQPGMPIDIQGFENQLNAAAFDLPVDLQISLRQINSTEVDVTIHLKRTGNQPGQILGGVLQTNNYGLTQFGRNQVLGNMRIAGFSPSSELTLTTQQSEGVGYYRADYEAPIAGSRSRVRGFTSQVQSKTTNSKGWSIENGLGVTALLSTNRNGRWFSGAELSRRETQNWASGLLSSDRVDQQLRFKLRTEVSNSWVDNFYNDLILTVGRVNMDRLSSDKLDDATTGLNVAGTYQKVEMSGAIAQALDSERILTGSVRWKAQAAAKNLDGYNRISLGGINGIRAYTSLDGVGDQGAQLSFDITHQVVADVFGGLFYDVGVVKNNHTPLPNASDSSAYLLQGLGWQVGGKINQFNWTLSGAHAFGKTPGPGVWTTTNTQPGDFRLNFSVTRPF